MLVRACAAEPEVLALVADDPYWDVPHRVIAAIDYLGVPYGRPEDLVAAVLDRRDFVRSPRASAIATT